MSTFMLVLAVCARENKLFPYFERNTKIEREAEKRKNAPNWCIFFVGGGGISYYKIAEIMRFLTKMSAADRSNAKFDFLTPTRLQCDLWGSKSHC